MLSWFKGNEKNNPTLEKTPKTPFESFPILSELQTSRKALKAKRDALEQESSDKSPDTLDLKKFKIFDQLDQSIETAIKEFNTTVFNNHNEKKEALIKLISKLFTDTSAVLTDQGYTDILMSPRQPAPFTIKVMLHFGVLGGVTTLFFSGPLSFLGMISGITGVAALPTVLKSLLTNSMQVLVDFLYNVLVVINKLQTQFQYVNPGPTYYEILGISSNASEAEIKAAYKTLAPLYHPDKVQDKIELFKQINEAHSILSDPTKRKEYDASLILLNLEQDKPSKEILRITYR